MLVTDVNPDIPCTLQNVIVSVQSVRERNAYEPSPAI